MNSNSAIKTAEITLLSAENDLKVAKSNLELIKKSRTRKIFQ